MSNINLHSASDGRPRPGHYWPDRATWLAGELDALRAELDTLRAELDTLRARESAKYNRERH